LFFEKAIRSYPFGLTMAGISSKAAGGFESTQKFQGQEFAHNEFSDGSGLEMYEFKYRMHDPQTGRFWQVDPLTDKYIYNSTYAFSENKVTSHFELEGLEAVEMNHRDPGLNSVPATKEEKENYTSTAGTAFVTGGVGLSIMVALVLQPEIGIPLAVSYLTGVPVSPSPQAIERFVATEVRTAAAVSSGTAEETVTLYRGVNKTSPAYGEALEGNVKPRGGSASPQNITQEILIAHIHHGQQMLK
jgi:RHS repeat-associated protein